MNKATHMFPLKRSSSLEFLPPDMSELRVVLLGNSWSQRRSVGNLMLKDTVFNTDEEPDQCLRFSRQMKEKEIVVINTPDLLCPDISEHKLTEHMKTCVRLSDPGPHVFLLVLQSEDFTEELKLRLCRVLKLFSDQSFDHSLVLISPQREKGSGYRYRYYAPVDDVIRRCGFRSLGLKFLGVAELLKGLCDVVHKNNGSHVTCDPLSMKPECELRVVLLGKSQDKMKTLCNFILEKKKINLERLSLYKQREVSAQGEWRGKTLTVVKTPDMFSLSVEEVREEVRNCVAACHPGPNVLLLLVKPSDFTEENRQTLKFILSLFGEDAFKYSMVIVTHDDEGESFSLKQLIQDCEQRQCRISFNKKDLPKNDHRVLMQKMENIVSENRGGYLCNVSKPSLNLVLCGSRAAEKTSAAEAILGQTELHSVSSSSECVKHQGEVCGRWVSLVELPALSGKPQEEVMKESFRCISLCDPEGVNAFILVLPVGPLTEEDKVELETIQKTFSSRVNDFTMILFTVESDPKHPAVVNFVKGNSDVQRISQSCGGRSVVLNIKDKQQIPELLETVEKMRHINKPCGYTREMFTCGKMDENLELKKNINTLEAELKDLKTKTMMSLETQSPESLRIVLLGKTGCGKSSSGNTILGRKEFKAGFSQTSVTKYCHKSESKVDGRHVVVVDTPGLFNSNLSHDQINEEMVKCVSLLAPGPHVFLLVFQIGRFIPEEKETVKFIKETFGKNSEKFTIVLLTGGDSLERDNMSVEEFIEKKCDDSFKKLISDCGGRYHVFNNLDEQNHTQVSELIKKMDTMVKENGGSCFTNDLLQEAEAAIKKETEKILKEKEEEMKREREELERKHKEEKEEMERKLEEQEKQIEKERKERDKQLKEMKKNIKKEREQRKKEEKTREEENRKREKEEEKQRLDLKKQLEQLDKLIQSEKEEKKSVNRELEKSRDEMRQKQETWEKKQEQWWKERRQEEEQRRQEEQMRITQLEEKYEKEIEKSENKRQEEDHNRRKLQKELDENYKTYLEILKKTYEDEARKKAEEVNEFKEEYRKRFAAQKKEHEEQMKEKDKDNDLLKALSVQQKLQGISDLVKCLRKKKRNLNRVSNLLDKQEEEMKKVKNEEIENLEIKHEKELSELMKDLQGEQEEPCTIQ